MGASWQRITRAKRLDPQRLSLATRVARGLRLLHMYASMPVADPENMLPVAALLCVIAPHVDAPPCVYPLLYLHAHAVARTQRNQWLCANRVTGHKA